MNTGKNVKKTTRQLQKDKTREDLLVTAKQLFIAHGYEGTTTRQIADAAGVATGTVFAHFSDKHRLLRELLSRDIENVLGEARTALADHAGAVEALLHYSRYLYTYYRSQWPLSQVLLKDAMFNTSYHEGQLGAFVGELAMRLRSDVPNMDADDRTILAQCLMANYFMVLIQGLGMPESTLDAWMAQLECSCRLLVRPYQGAP